MVVLGIDLVEWMIRGAGGDFAFLDAPAPTPRGHAVQVRLYAEDPALDYRPTSGTLTAVDFPADIRAETRCMAGSTVSGVLGMDTGLIDFVYGSLLGPTPVAPVNQLAMLSDYIDPTIRVVAHPNQDVVYGFGALALDKEPVILQVPDFGLWLPQASGQLQAPVQLARLMIFGALNWAVQWYQPPAPKAKQKSSPRASLDDLTDAALALFLRDPT